MIAVASLWSSTTSWITPTAIFLFINLVIGSIAVTSRFSSNKRQRHQQDHHDSHGQLERAPSLLDRVKSLDFSLYKFQNHNQEQQSHFFQQHTEHGYDTNPVQTHRSQLTRDPSLLDRVKSINFALYKFRNHTQEQNLFQGNTELPYDTNPDEPEQPQLARVPSFLEQVKSINLSSVYRSQKAYPEKETETETEAIHNPEAERETERNSDHEPKRSKSETKKKLKSRVQESMKKSVSEKSMMMEKEDEDRESVESRRPQTARLEKTVTIGDGDHGVDAKADDFINNFKHQLRLQRLDSLLRNKEMPRGR